MNAVTGVLGDLSPAGRLGMGQVELAAALNVTQAAVSQWATGRRQVPPPIARVLHRAEQARAIAAVTIGTDGRGRPIQAPAERWEPVFTPKGRFRLPLRLDWSGTSEHRWRNAEDPQQVLETTAIVMEEGSAADIVMWVDPQMAAAFWPSVPIARSRRQAWDKHLTSLGYEVQGHVAV